MICCFIILITILLAFLLSPFALLITGGIVALGAVKIFRGGEQHTLGKEQALALEYPYITYYKTIENVDSAFELVKNHKLKFVKTNYKIMNMPELDDELKFQGDKTLIELQPSDYYTMNWMSDWFNGNCRLKCKRYDEDLSPADYWEKNKDKIVDECVSENALTYEKLNDKVYSQVRGCNNFRPGLMRGFIDHFGAKSVLDFSAGWGDRLIGAIAADARYVGVDPNPCVHVGYKKIIDKFATDKSKYTMIESPFQTAELPAETFDLVFTSPPYFDLEIYSDNSDQSVSEFSTLDSWFDGFLMKSVTKAWDKLNVGGHMVIIINDSKDKKYTMDMVQAINKFSDAKYHGVVSYADKIGLRYKSPQPMWVWEKIN